ncbi:MAG: M48 family metallopeptidase [Flavisolibacter sp.]|nr:M48 family metallopeptidase [Flavisolibacter sp.]
MDRYNATYYCNANTYPASVTLERDRLCIQLKEDGKPLFVYWYYEQIRESKRTATFEYPGYPLQTLEVLDAALASDICNLSEQSRNKVVRNRMGPVLLRFAAVVLFLMLAYILLVPVLTGALANSFPIENERGLGRQLFSSMQNDFAVDEKRTAYINTFFDELKIPSRYPIQITVVKSEVANAFAMPGGYIVVYDQLLKDIHTYEELAAILAHEFVHIENRHTLRSLFRRMGGYLFISLLLGDAGGISALLLNQAENLKSLSYSRSLEKEADEKGAALLVQRNIDCRGFVWLFQALKKENHDAPPSEWLSSHPDLEKRIRNISKSNSCRGEHPEINETLQTLFLKIKTAE